MAEQKKTTRTTAKASIMRATTSGSWHNPKTDLDETFTAGQLIRSTDPIVKALPDAFADIEEFDRPEVEQATAAPGEKRGG